MVDPVTHSGEIGGQAHVDAWALEQPLEKTRVAVARHGLEGVREVAVLVIGADRDARRDRRIELARVEAPLLARVTPEEELVQLPADTADHDVLGGPNPPARFGPLRVEALHLLGGAEARAVQPVDRRAIDRQGDETVADARQDAVLVWAPLREAR